MDTIFLPHSHSTLRDVELLAIVDSAPGVPSYIAGAVVVRGENPEREIETQALPVDELDREPLQQLRALLAERCADPVRILLAAQGQGRASDRAWWLHRYDWPVPMVLQEGGGAPEAAAIGDFLKQVIAQHRPAKAAR